MLLLQCVRGPHRDKRRTLAGEFVYPWTPGSTVETMLLSNENWDAVWLQAVDKAVKDGFKRNSIVAFEIIVYFHISTNISNFSSNFNKPIRK